MAERIYDLAVIGGGIVGVAVAHAVGESLPGLSLIVLEKEPGLARHQTGNNSGVIHSGLYYRPGSLKARNCIAGREMLYAFCQEHRLPHERCGKLVVATRESQLPALAELESRGVANGLQGLVRLDAAGIRRQEPHAAGIAALWVPQTGIVDFVAVTEAMASLVRQHGGEIRTSSRVFRIRREGGNFRLSTASGEVRSRFLVVCAGLQADRVARLAGVMPPVRVVPFRGEYYRLRPERRSLVKNLIYPVPDPALPFLGVHFTRMIDGEVEAGPNAVLALKREGYKKSSFSLRDSLETLAWPGFWRMARGYAAIGLQEYYRSFSKRAFVRELRH
ncbi:MAG: L-2-hydroxyglutarate oxidase, partial [Desulfuromonadales bacterium]|nr:L-2-hydroxyglutarate oxidase [Desulfuromonadales bacterium]